MSPPLPDLSDQLQGYVRLLRRTPEIHLRQKFEMAELFGFETRNKFRIESSDGAQIGFAAEQGKGILGHISRYFLGHWRPFDLLFFDGKGDVTIRARHPFRIYFQRLEVSDSQGKRLGVIQRRFSIFTKRFDVQDSQGNVLLEMSSPFWRIWTFPFRTVDGREVARIEKKWSGVLTEGFTDKDRFRIVLKEGAEDALVPLILVAGIFVDLQYFERKASA